MPIFGSRNRNARRREWLGQDRLRRALQRGFHGQLRREFRRTGREAAKGFEQDGELGLDAPVLAHSRRLAAIYAANLSNIMREFGQRLFSAAGVEIDPENSDFTRRVVAYLDSHGADKVVRVSTTTRKQIRDAISRGAEDGLGQRGIARRIREATSGELGRLRSNVIARTEVHQASQVATSDAVATAGLERRLDREWIAAQDDRTRDSHSAADGQLRGAGEPFDIGGTKLMFPGDPTGPPAEVISCRCVVGYVLTDVVE